MRPPPEQLFETLLTTDPDVLDATELDALTGRLAEMRSWCDALQVRITRRQRALAAEGRGADPRNQLTRHGRASSKDAKSADEREQVCSAMPAFEDALAAGTISAGHVDAVANATRNLDEPVRNEFHANSQDVLAEAERLGVDGFARAVRERARALAAADATESDAAELERQRARAHISRWTDPATGMCHTHLELDPLSDRELWTAVQQHRNRLAARDDRPATWDRLTVDALLAAVQAAPGAVGRKEPRISVVIDLRTLVDGLHDRSICETDAGSPLPVSTVRRLGCDADVVPIVLGGDSVPLDMGRARRLATSEQRQAIESIHRTCVHPDCSVTVDDCRIHHIRHWAAGGATDLDDLAPVCEQHHHLVHEGGWTLTMTSDRVATWIRPDGVVHSTGPTIDRRPAMAAT